MDIHLTRGRTSIDNLVLWPCPGGRHGMFRSSHLQSRWASRILKHTLPLLPTHFVLYSRYLYTYSLSLISFYFCNNVFLFFLY